MKKSSFILIVIALIVVSVVFISYVHHMSVRLTRADQAIESQMVKVQEDLQKENEYRERLALWVFDRSSKISRPTTRQIVDEVFRYDHPLLLLAIYQPESEFSPTARSHRDCIGLGQVRWNDGEKDVWGKALITAGICKEKRDLYDIPTNIRASNFILTHELKKAKGDVVQALRGYVGGHQKGYVEQISANALRLAMIKKA